MARFADRLRRDRRLILTLSTPTFWLGIVLILLFADQLRWLPASGRGDWRNLVLPAVTLAAPSVGLLTRLVRATMTDVLRLDCIRTARAKGCAGARSTSATHCGAA